MVPHASDRARWPWLVAASAPAVIAVAAIATAPPVRYTTTTRQVYLAILTAPLWAVATWLTFGATRVKALGVRCAALGALYVACLATFGVRVVDQEGFGVIDLMTIPALACAFEAVVLSYPRRRARSADGAAAGWFVDPRGRFELRYWDSRRWTVDVRSHGAITQDPDGI